MRYDSEKQGFAEYQKQKTALTGGFLCFKWMESSVSGFNRQAQLLHRIFF